MSARFYLALWAGKLAQAIYGLSDYRDDHPGYFALRIDNDFIKEVVKPEYNVIVTGTNGKTSITNMMQEALKSAGRKVACNDWGGNARAVLSWVMLKSATVFNKPAVEFAVMEADELVSRNTFPEVNPSHIIITNLGRDSMFRNASPEMAQASLQEAVEKLPDATLILNGDDPLSCFLGKNNRRIYFGVADTHEGNVEHISNDFAVCPVCGGIPQYHYRNYRHYGEFECPDCGLKSPEKDYLCTNITEETITVREKAGEFTYPAISPTIYNIYNETAMIAFFRSTGFTPEEVANMMAAIRLPQIREQHETVEGIEIVKRTAKGQNASAMSTVLDTLRKDPANKLVILMEDEEPKETTLETINWIWDSDFQFLSDDTVRRIIVSGRRHLDHKVRLLAAGVDSSRLFICLNDSEITSFLTREGIERIYILYDIMALERSGRVFDDVRDWLKGNRA